jgi:hypothetical protein
MVLSRSISHDLGAAVAVALVTSSFLPEKSRQVPQKWHKPYRNATAAAPANLAATAPPQPNDKHRRGDSLKSFSKLKKGLFPECSFSQSALSRPWEDHESTCESMTLKRCRFLEKIMRNDKMSETMSDSSLKRSGSRLDQ